MTATLFARPTLAQPIPLYLMSPQLSADLFTVVHLIPSVGSELAEGKKHSAFPVASWSLVNNGKQLVCIWWNENWEYNTE